MVVIEKVVILNKLDFHQMAESLTKKLKNWIKNLLGGMGGALISEKSQTEPPSIGDQPYKDKPKKGVL